MSRMPCNIEDGPDYEEPVYDHEEPDLNDTLRNITLSQIAPLKREIDRIEDVIESLSQSVYTKRQA